MVKVREVQALELDGSVNLELWLCKLNERDPTLSLARIREVCDLSQQAEAKAFASNSIWAPGHSSFAIGLDMADILTELHMDEDGIVAAIIYRAVRENWSTESCAWQRSATFSWVPMRSCWENGRISWNRPSVCWYRWLMTCGRR
jgi:GTP pyrophosphokinase